MSGRPLDPHPVRLQCAKPRCGRKPTQRHRVASWFTSTLGHDEHERIYLVCPKHDAAYFDGPDGFTGDLSERVRRDLAPVYDPGVTEAIVALDGPSPSDLALRATG